MEHGVSSHLIFVIQGMRLKKTTAELIVTDAAAKAAVEVRS